MYQYIPRNKRGKKSRSSGTGYDYLARAKKSAENQLQELAASGQVDEFTAYQNDQNGLLDTAWSALKKGGSSALDLVSRAGYATGGAMEEAFQGNPQNIPGRVGTELFSGLGGLKGQKELPSDILRQETDYGKFGEEHPIASMATDFGADVLLDPSTYTGGLAIKGAGKLLSKGGKGIAAVAKKTKTGEKIADTLGRSFDPAYLWKKAGAEKGYDIVWQEGKFADALRAKYGKEIDPIVKTLRGRNFTPPQVAEFIRVGYGDIPIEEASKEVQALMPQVRDVFKTMGRRDYRYIGKNDPAESMIENYLPNRPMAYNELMSTAGKRSMTGYSTPGGFKDLNKSFQKGKVLKEGEDVLGFMQSKGVVPKDMGEAMARSIETRAGESVAKVRVIRTQDRLVKELPETFRKVKAGTRVPWDKQLQAGESLWMPAGNLRFFQTTLNDVIPKSLMDEILTVADSGGMIDGALLGKIDEAIEASTKTIINTTKSGNVVTSGPLKKLEEVVTGALQSRGMSAGEAGVYINKLRSSGGNGVVTTIENTTTINKEKLGDYIKSLMAASGNAGRKIDPQLLEGLNKKILGVTTRVPVYAVPTEVAEALTQLSHGMSKGTVVDWWDKVLGTFKNTATLWPGFHLRNLESSTAQNYIAGVKPERYADVTKVLLGKNPNEIVLGKSVAGWKNIMERNGILGGGFIGQQVGKATGTLGKIAEPVFKTNRAVGQKVENISRAALFMDRVEKGLDPLEAAKAVKKWHFDYRELTGFEQGVARRAVPFYAWSRKNLPLQLEMIFKAPNKYRNIAYLKHAVAGGKYDENAPEWWEQQDVWQTKFENKAGDKMAVSMGLPYADLNMLQGNPAGMLGPASTILNTVNNYDSFLEKPIQEFKGQKKPLFTAGNFQLDQIPGLNNPKVLYALQGLAPILKRYGTDLSAEVSRILTGKEKPDDKYRAIAKVIGVRVLPNVKSEQEKRRVLQLLNDLREFKKYKEQEGAR